LEDQRGEQPTPPPMLQLPVQNMIPIDRNRNVYRRRGRGRGGIYATNRRPMRRGKYVPKKKGTVFIQDDRYEDTGAGIPPVVREGSVTPQSDGVNHLDSIDGSIDEIEIDNERAVSRTLDVDKGGEMLMEPHLNLMQRPWFVGTLRGGLALLAAWLFTRKSVIVGDRFVVNVNSLIGGGVLASVAYFVKLEPLTLEQRKIYMSRLPFLFDIPISLCRKVACLALGSKRDAYLIDRLKQEVRFHFTKVNQKRCAVCRYYDREQCTHNEMECLVNTVQMTSYMGVWESELLQKLLYGNSKISRLIDMLRP